MERSGTGTYVNGMRAREHWLEPGDQVVVGSTVFVYREEAAVAAVSPQHVLLRACSLLFLFRALASSSTAALRDVLEGQLLQLIGEVAPLCEGAVVLGRDAAELRAASGYCSWSAMSRRSGRPCSAP